MPPDPHAEISSVLKQRHWTSWMRGLHECGIHPVIMKGAAFSHYLYPVPGSRPYSDVDLLVEKQEVPELVMALQSMGFKEVPTMGKSQVRTERSMVKQWQAFPEFVDIHWEISGWQVVSRTLSCREIRERAMKLDVGGLIVDTLCLPHALIHTCVHLISHRLEIRDSYWLRDIHLLLERCSETELLEFVHLAAERRVRSICRACIDEAQTEFGTVLPPWMTDELPYDFNEPSVWLLRRKRTALSDGWGQWKSLNWNERTEWLKDALFPAPAYMHHLYQDADAFLGWLYLRRLWEKLKPSGHR